MLRRFVSWSLLLAVCLLQLSAIGLPVHATDADPFMLIPKAKQQYGEDVIKLTDPNKSKEFRDSYNDTADKYAKGDAKVAPCDIGSMLSSGVVTRDTILCLLIRIVKFVANMALVVGAAVIIYAGYLYVITAMGGVSSDETSKANTAIKNVAIGLVIVIFSYAIQRIVTQAFLN